MDQFYGKPNGPVSAGDAADQRTSRDSLFLMAQFRLFGRQDEWQVRIRNLSAGGLMAELPEALAIGTPVEVEVRGIGWILGRVAWAAAGRVGVAFEREIDPRKARKPVASGTRTPVFVKPILPLR